MIKSFTLLSIFLLINLPSYGEESNHWDILFDGRSLNNFRGYKKDKPGNAWTVEDKFIKLKKEKGKVGGDLMTQGKYQFFELQLEWCLPKPGNSGIIFRVGETDGPAYKTGPEMQIFHKMNPGGKFVSRKIESRVNDFIMVLNLNDKLIWNQNIFRSFKKFPNSRAQGMDKIRAYFLKIHRLFCRLPPIVKYL